MVFQFEKQVFPLVHGGGEGGFNYTLLACRGVLPFMLVHQYIVPVKGVGEEGNNRCLPPFSTF